MAAAVEKSEVTMTNMSAELDALREEANVCRSQDDQKHALIAKLLSQVGKLSAKISDTERQLSHQKEVNDMSGDRIADLKDKIRTFEEEHDRLAFAFVVVDGDNMLFRDDLVNDGLEGGKETARRLKEAVQDHLKSLVPNVPPRLEVIIRVYANLQGLAWAYSNTTALTLDAFIRGFNMDDPLCDFVDAGDGKECADEKVKASFKLHSKDVHCRHIFFGASADNGYARLLDPLFRHEETIRKKTCLIEGPYFVQELRKLAEKCDTVKFISVFRDQQLPTVKRRVASPVNVAPSTEPQPSFNYAGVAASAPAVSELPLTSSSPKEPKFAKVLRNSKGQRVDERLSYAKIDFVTLMNRKLCNNFHLLGSCPYPNCYHEHDQHMTLNAKQKIALRAIARQTPCDMRLLCDDPKCILGHRCTRNDCTGECKFHEDMHNVDTTVVN